MSIIEPNELSDQYLSERLQMTEIQKIFGKPCCSSSCMINITYKLVCHVRHSIWRPGVSLTERWSKVLDYIPPNFSTRDRFHLQDTPVCLNAFAQICGLSARTIMKHMRNPTAPAHYQVGPKEAAIVRFINAEMVPLCMPHPRRQAVPDGHPESHDLSLPALYSLVGWYERFIDALNCNQVPPSNHPTYRYFLDVLHAKFPHIHVDTDNPHTKCDICSTFKEEYDYAIKHKQPTGIIIFIFINSITFRDRRLN